MNYELDRKAFVFMLEIWKPASVAVDELHAPVSVSSEGRIVGHSEIIVPENDLERWATLGVNLYREAPIDPATMVPLLTIDEAGRILGDVGDDPEFETPAPIPLREDWS